MSGTTEHSPGLVRLRISRTIDNEWATRSPDFIPERLRPGSNLVTLEEARAILADAEFNSDLQAVEVGEYGMPLGTFNAYRALAKQARAAIEIMEERAL